MIRKMMRGINDLFSYCMLKMTVKSVENYTKKIYIYIFLETVNKPLRFFLYLKFKKHTSNDRFFELLKIS